MSRRIDGENKLIDKLAEINALVLEMMEEENDTHYRVVKQAINRKIENQDITPELTQTIQDTTKAHSYIQEKGNQASEILTDLLDCDYLKGLVTIINDLVNCRDRYVTLASQFGNWLKDNNEWVDTLQDNNKVTKQQLVDEIKHIKEMVDEAGVTEADSELQETIDDEKYMVVFELLSDIKKKDASVKSLKDIYMDLF